MNIGDLVKGASTGKIGIVTKSHPHPNENYYNVQFHDNTYTIHINNLEPLEKK